ncbi:hypothetical protein [Leptothoe sp. PORK10 BA2]|uniref:hypothetical protein n=1 Tax=Leptothoe sp. PORK10 BA2 TaxID=3110254 RepID=UPI002B1EA03F|nr:hypothetical protein [Leptothoe sp. PORK10 BA2]MEA5466292.1 hypothetical protein [Leptothoe sp. PORK10 BA2]
MARINLKRATVPLVTGQVGLLELIGKIWQMRSHNPTLEFPEPMRLRARLIKLRRRPKAPNYPISNFAENCCRKQIA